MIINKCAKFGPSGSDVRFSLEGHKHTIEMPLWLKNQDMDLYEYSFGRGINIGKDKAIEIGEEFKKQGIEISVHAPYFINFASQEDEKVTNSIGYLTNSLLMLKNFGGERCVFHPGAQGSMERSEAFKKTKDGFEKALEEINNLKLNDLIVCPETMGKHGQIGTVDEIIELCKLGDNVIPCIDFGHVNSFNQGSLKTAEDFQKIIDKLFDGLGEYKTKNIHVHFSKIQYGAKGEIKHLTFEDTIYGPEFEPLGETIVKNGLTPHILCESAGTQCDDSIYMKNFYKSL